MATFNKIIVLGNLTRDPELTTIPSGTQVCSFGIASNRHYRTEAGGEQQETLFIDVEAWGKQADLVSKYLFKGSACLVDGRLKLEQWQDEETQAKRSRFKIVMEGVQFLGAPREASAANAQGAQGSAEGDSREGASSRSSRRGKPLPTERLNGSAATASSAVAQPLAVSGKGKVPIPF